MSSESDVFYTNQPSESVVVPVSGGLIVDSSQLLGIRRRALFQVSGTFTRLRWQLARVGPSSEQAD